MKLILLGAVALILLTVATLAYLVFVPTETEERVVNVRPGDNPRIIASRLYSADIIGSEVMFVLLTKIRSADRYLKPGSYIFGGKTSLWQTVSRIRDGKSQSIVITFPEGMSLYRTLKKIDRSGLMPFDSLMAAATNPALIKRLTGLDVPSLEGFLYPETYSFSLDLSADSILAVQTAEFFKRMRSAGINHLEIPGFYSKLILASIVEKESGPATEREIIAGVFANRMARGMRLQSCPTVDYIMEPKGIRREVLRYKDTQILSPYNTYMVAGLPPTPIANPSLESVVAALNPKPHNYMYFFADRKGNNVFSRSYEEHLQKQRQYLKN